jgi:hypothetical protein
MMKRLYVGLITAYLIVFNVFTTCLYAINDDDPGLPGEDDPGQPPQASIDDCVPFVLLVAIGLVFYYTHKKKYVHS